VAGVFTGQGDSPAGVSISRENLKCIRISKRNQSSLTKKASLANSLFLLKKVAEGRMRQGGG
jgi:hypothetical protein